jgi:hypothetical protein
MGRHGRIEVTLFRRQTTFLYFQMQNGALDSQPLQRGETEKPFQARALLMDEQGLTLSQDAAQDGMQITGMEQKIDDVFQRGKNNQAFLRQQSELIGAVPLPRLRRLIFVELPRRLLAIFCIPTHSER